MLFLSHFIQTSLGSSSKLVSANNKRQAVNNKHLKCTYNRRLVPVMVERQNLTRSAGCFNTERLSQFEQCFFFKSLITGITYCNIQKGFLLYSTDFQGLICNTDKPRDTCIALSSQGKYHVSIFGYYYFDYFLDQ